MRDNKGRFVKGHEKIGGFSKGDKHKKLSKSKVSQSLFGKIGSNSRRWKGQKASYEAKHMWIIKYYGNANKCQQKNCNYKNPKRYEWHNLSGEYKRGISDYIQLCPSCHRKIDMERMELCVL